MSAPTSPNSRSPRSASDDATAGAGLTGGFDGERDILRAWSRGLTPDPHLTVSEWADRQRRVAGEVFLAGLRRRRPEDGLVVPSSCR